MKLKRITEEDHARIMLAVHDNLPGGPFGDRQSVAMIARPDRETWWSGYWMEYTQDQNKIAVLCGGKLCLNLS